MRPLGAIVALGALRTTVPRGSDGTHPGRISTMRKVTTPTGSGGLARR